MHPPHARKAARPDRTPTTTSTRGPAFSFTGRHGPVDARTAGVGCSAESMEYSTLPGKQQAKELIPWLRPPSGFDSTACLDDTIADAGRAATAQAWTEPLVSPDGCESNFVTPLALSVATLGLTLSE
ncbi:hypothetical protein DAI22_08g138850 [Oryza sativa Japonica Group]|nr:hypothetical protein DAI22_08g138850 [Oryza sativa Japonica Group]